MTRHQGLQGTLNRFLVKLPAQAQADRFVERQ